MHVVIFEGSRWSAFAPLSLGRPVFNLITGTASLLDKQIQHLAPSRLTLWVRPELESYCRERIVPRLGRLWPALPVAVNTPLGNDPAMLVNGRSVHLGKFEHPPHDAVMAHGEGESDEVVQFARVHTPGLSRQDALGRSDRWRRLLELPRMRSQGRMVDSLVDLVHWNEESLIEDASRLPHPAPPKAAGPYHLCNPDEIWIGPGAKVEPGAVLDAGKGPVVIAEGAVIGANAVVQGPAYIGSHATVRPLAQVRPGTSIGPVCKVGGEVSSSILLGYSNKSHEGFLGHSYVGRWVNLGAGTTTSNMKNTYGEIAVQRRTGGEAVPTGRRFLGALIGDHAKTGILTRLPAGAYLGFSSMLADSGAAPRFVPSYTFWTDAGPTPYDPDKAIEVAKRAFARRDRAWTETDERIMRHVASSAPQVESRA